MAPKELTRHQLSSKLAYSSHTPSFLLKLQNKVAGRLTGDDEDEPQYLDGVDEFGRERRPPVPERPEADERGSDDEDGRDEQPMVVVLKEGKHLTEQEAENERRKAKGLPPLFSNATEPSFESYDGPHAGSVAGPSKPAESASLSFSSKKSRESRSSTTKRKTQDRDEQNEEGKQNPKKKAKKAKKGLLSFDRDDMG